MAKYVLPDLKYDYGALEPHISGEIIQLHHDKHHRAYVEGANKAIEQLEEARAKKDFDRVTALEHTLAFNVSGHVLHSLYWQNLAPKAGGKPSGELARTIDRDFGSFDAFKSQLNKLAETVMGSGWAALVFDPIGQRLVTTQIHDHQSEMTQAGIPIMVLDAWEHAYYLQYRTEKAKYFDAIWNLWNWEDVAARFNVVQSVDLRLEHVIEQRT